MAHSLYLVRITCPDQQVAMTIAENAIDHRLAACANIEGPVKAVYRWQGKIERAEEFVLWLKAPEANMARIETLVNACHPYDLPAIIAIPCPYTNSAFAAWVSEETRTEC